MSEKRRLDGSFVALRRLTQSFEDLGPRGRPASHKRERSLRRVARELGATAVPACVRELAASDERRAEWAYALLEDLARDAGCRPRIGQALAELAESREVGDRAVLRAVALLDALGEPIPDGVSVRDPDAAYRRALATLADSLAHPEEAARIADGLVAGATEDRMAELAGNLVGTHERAGSALLAELLARHEIEGPFRLELERMAALVPAPTRVVPIADRSYRGARGRRTVVVAAAGRASSPEGAGHGEASAQGEGLSRVLTTLIDESGSVFRAHCRTTADLDGEVLVPLADEGYDLEAVSADEARRTLERAAARAVGTRGTLPREFYVGRHLLGLTGEHLPAPERGPRERARVLTRARELLARRQPHRARLLLEAFLRGNPADADARASLGLCLLAAGEPGGARAEFERAAALEPDQPTHLWNLAAAAHRDGRPGGCYLALGRFLTRAPAAAALADPSIDDRRSSARAYMEEYERLAGLEHPDTDVLTVARAEAIYCGAKLTLARGEADTTIAALREVVARVPTHYAAWTHLGMALSVRGHLQDARASLERALALRPGDPAAHEALRSLQGADPRGAL